MRGSSLPFARDPFGGGCIRLSDLFLIFCKRFSDDILTTF
ncbi:MAG: hypothetical protein BSOLF_1158 [Candidatus Carbobacillus altaicus]|uniref:Uncharacterized protein n=1 Tax=Candidatus Carbonibacillus altaicus TaxID=2163959 RepID=A0A2R6Y4M7_9BACL|nr:MAG: hypothetical protein BSOLF_1158 [Candidatus Carbobacillus altaicus]